MAGNALERLAELHTERQRVASIVYGRVPSLYDDELHNLDQERIRLSQDLAKEVLLIPSVYTDVRPPIFQYNFSIKPPFLTSFDFDLKTNGIRNPTIDLSTEALFAVKDNSSQPFLEITEDAQPLWHLPEGFRMEMYGGFMGLARFGPFTEEGERSYLFEHTSEGAYLSPGARERFFWDGWNTGRIGAYWVPELTDTPTFVQPEPMYNPMPENYFNPKEWYDYVNDENGQLGTKKLPDIGKVLYYSY